MSIWLKSLFGTIVRQGNLQVTTASGQQYSFGDGTGQLVSIKLADKTTELKLLFNPSLYLGEAYMDETLVLEQGNLRDLIQLLMINLHRQWPSQLRFLEHFRTAIRRLRQYNPVKRSFRNIAHHYDLDGSLYDLFLDSDRQYSCGYFETASATLEEAQLAKKRHIAAKLDIKPGQRVLEIGSGWGGLGLYLCGLEDITYTGLTLSREQLEISRNRARDAGLSDRIDFRLQDYREVVGPFDRIVSVGMFEHVGVGHFDEFFTKVHDLITEDGIALLHAIGRFDGPGATNPWLNKYIFPGGYSPALSEVIPVIERQKLYTTDIEILRGHYADTLHEWYERFMVNWDQAAAKFDDRFCRMWEFYLVACELSFRYQDLMVFQIQMTKALDVAPLTREYMFAWEAAQRAQETAPAPTKSTTREFAN